MKNKIVHRNHHHLVPRCRGGQDLDSNIILIKIPRHDSWHALWDMKDHSKQIPRTINEIIALLRESPYYSTPCSSHWRKLWGLKSSGEVLAILLRLKAIKKAQQQHYFI